MYLSKAICWHVVSLAFLLQRPAGPSKRLELLLLFLAALVLQRPPVRVRPQLPRRHRAGARLRRRRRSSAQRATRPAERLVAAGLHGRRNRGRIRLARAAAGGRGAGGAGRFRTVLVEQAVAEGDAAGRGGGGGGAGGVAACAGCGRRRGRLVEGRGRQVSGAGEVDVDVRLDDGDGVDVAVADLALQDVDGVAPVVVVDGDRVALCEARVAVHARLEDGLGVGEVDEGTLLRLDLDEGAAGQRGVLDAEGAALRHAEVLHEPVRGDGRAGRRGELEDAAVGVHARDGVADLEHHGVRDLHAGQLGKAGVGQVDLAAPVDELAVGHGTGDALEVFGELRHFFTLVCFFNEVQIL
eukprot:Rhum_TRINITY_DN8893_c0_g2::Rhum_TRINITY_DN8893_c0_g2_i1::g.30378::m.30378